MFVTHSRDEVYRMCDRVCVLTDGRGGRTVPTSELFDAPATLAEALISGCKNVSPAVPVGPETLDCADWGVRLACGRAVAGCAHAGIRAHFLRIVEADGRPVDTIGDVATGFGSARGQGEQCAASRSRVVARSRAENRIPCTVARVIDNVFSTIVMCATPGGACLRVELGKDAWAALGCPARVTLQVAPSDVMPLVD